MSHNIKPGVATGKEVQNIFNYAKAKGFALPAVNVIGSNTINGVLETAAALNAPVIIQFSNGGGVFNAGKGLNNEGQKAAIAGSIAGDISNTGDLGGNTFITVFFKINRALNYLIFRFFTFINVFPVIEIYFESKKEIVKNCQNNFFMKILN
mgnify:CR=1 FL=1